MSRLEQILSLQNAKGREWLGADLVQGDPRSDGAIELVMKQGVPRADHVGMVNCGCGAWLNSLQQNKALTAVHLFVEDHHSFVRNAERMQILPTLTTSVIANSNPQYFSTLATPKDLSALATCDVVVFRIFRDMAANWIWIQAMLAAMKSSATLQIVGKKDDGIQSIETHLSKAGIDVDSLAVGCHSRWLALPANAETAKLPSPLETVSVLVKTPVGELALWIPEGTFAAGHLDTGTALLLQNLGDLQNKSVWDFGCGAGVITCTALRANAARVYASDHSLLAVQATQKNIAADSARAQAEVHFLGDGFSETFDVVLSNPPFHLEGREMRSMGSLWLAACLEHLAPNGEIRIVANSFLPYSTFAQDLKLKSEMIAEIKGFKVWRMTR